MAYAFNKCGQTVALVVTTESSDVVELQLKSSKEDGAELASVLTLADKVRDSIRGQNEFDVRSAHRIYEILFEPTRKQLDKKKRLIIVPAGWPIFLSRRFLKMSHRLRSKRLGLGTAIHLFWRPPSGALLRSAANNSQQQARATLRGIRRVRGSVQQGARPLLKVELLSTV